MKCCKLFFVIMVLPVFLFAHQTESYTRIQDVVITATMSEKALTEAPGSIEVITSEDIKSINAFNVADVLELAAGLVVSQESGRILMPSIRGARSKHSLILIDGRRIAVGFNDMVDIRQIPVSIIDRIEIVRGAASALYGSDALGGVVNIITKSCPDELSGEISAKYSYNNDADAKNYSGSILFGGPFNNSRFLISAEKVHKDGWDLTGSLPDDRFENAPLYLAGKFEHYFSDNDNLTAGFEYTENTYEGLQQRGPGGARVRTYNEKRTGYFIKYNRRFRDIHKIMFRINQSDYGMDMSFDPYVKDGERETDQNLTQFEVQYSGINFNNHLITAGAEIRKEEVEDIQLDGDVIEKENMTNISIFVQDEFNITDPLYLVLGLRYDNHNEFGNRFTARTSSVYNINNNSRIKAGLSQGFRAPSLTELYLTTLRRRGRDEYAGNPDLKPEKSLNYELGFEGNYNRFYFGLTGFYNEIENLIESVFDTSTGSGGNRSDYYNWENIAESTIKGLETVVGVQLSNCFTFDGNFTFMDIDNKTTSGDIGAQPKQKGFLRLSYNNNQLQIKSNIQLNYTGRKVYDENNRFSYAVYNYYFSKGFNDNLSLFAGIDNVFNKNYEHDDRTRLDPRSYYGGVNYKF